jgi:NADPH:quinone reductase-like Zn-dependent oxidoreductase
MTIMASVQPRKPFEYTGITPRRVDEKMQDVTMSLPTPASTPSPLHMALTVNERYEYELSSAPPPSIGEHEVLIRTKAVGLNPIDWKTVDFKFCMPSLPWINGRECSGVVEAVGAAVQSVSKGQRVWSSTYYKDRRAGCFQELVVAPEHTVIPLPNSIPFHEAACLGVGGLTAAMTLWRWFGIPAKRIRQTRSTSRDDRAILIWGGSTITGQFAIQLAVEAGLKVIAVASRRTRRRVLSLGAHHVIARDGRTLGDIASEIQQVGGDNIVFGIDLVSPQTAALGVACLSKSRPARFAPLAVPAPPIQAPRNVEIVNVEMKQFVLNPLSRIYALKLTEMVQQGRVRVPEIVVSSGGLRDVEAGLRRLKGGDMGGRKLVIEI